MAYCSKCGNEIKKIVKFCPQCGNPMDQTYLKAALAAEQQTADIDAGISQVDDPASDEVERALNQSADAYASSAAEQADAPTEFISFGQPDAGQNPYGQENPGQNIYGQSGYSTDAGSGYGAGPGNYGQYVGGQYQRTGADAYQNGGRSGNSGSSRNGRSSGNSGNNRNGRNSGTNREKEKKRTIYLVGALIAVVAVVAILAVLLLGRIGSSEEFDPFENVTVVFTGSDSNASASVDASASEYAAYFDYYVSPAHGLSTDDEVTVYIVESGTAVSDSGEVTIDTDALTKYCKSEIGKTPVRTEKTYIVKDLEQYLSDPSAITEDGAAVLTEALQQYAESSVPEGAALNGVTYLGSCLYYTDDPAISPQNWLMPVARVDVSLGNGDYFSYYVYLTYSSVMIDSEGLPVLSGEGTSYNASNQVVSGDNTITYAGYATLADLTAELTARNTDGYTLLNGTTDQPKENSLSAGGADAQNNSDSSAATEKSPDDKTEESPVSYWGGHSTTDGQIFPNSSTELLTDDQVNALTAEQAQDAINEIYARHGAIFAKYPDLNNYYGQFDWYEGTTPIANITSSSFNSVENSNIAKLSSRASGASFSSHY